MIEIDIDSNYEGKVVQMNTYEPIEGSNRYIATKIEKVVGTDTFSVMTNSVEKLSEDEQEKVKNSFNYRGTQSELFKDTNNMSYIGSLPVDGPVVWRDMYDGKKIIDSLESKFISEPIGRSTSVTRAFHLLHNALFDAGKVPTRTQIAYGPPSLRQF